MNADLNDAQREAVLETARPVLVLAGPGTGKTKMLTAKFAHLVLDQGIPAERILITTFTRKATQELEDRITRNLQANGHYSKVHVQNFHSLALDILTRHAPEQYGREPVLLEGVTLLRFVFEHRSEFDWSDVPGYARWVNGPIEKLTKLTSRMLTEGIAPEECLRRVEERHAEWPDQETFQEVRAYATNYEKVLELLRANRRLTYDLMLYDAVELLQRSESVRRELQGAYDYLLVDEVQDNNTLQARMVELLSGGRPFVTVVGDEDQGIFKFRGAKRDVLADYQSRVQPRVINLSANYRSSANIVDAAWRLIALNSQRFAGKSLTAQGANRANPAKVLVTGYPDDDQEAIQTAIRIEADIAAGRKPRDIAVLLRSLNQVKRLLEELEARQVPFEVANTGELLRFREVRDTWAWMRVLHDPYTDNPAFERVLSGAAVGLPILDLGRIQARFRNAMRERAAKEGRDPQHIRLNLVDVLKDLEGAWVDHESRRRLRWAARTIEHLSARVRNLPPSEAAFEVAAFLRPQGRLGLDGGEHEQTWRNLAHFLRVVRGYEESHPDARTLGDFLAYLDFLDRQGAEFQDHEPDAAEDSVKILTVHSSKGLEFPVVHIMACSARRFPPDHKRDWMQPILQVATKEELQAQHLEEERRLFYVAMTRAQQELRISFPLRIADAERARSPFIDELLGVAPKETELVLINDTVAPADLQQHDALRQVHEAVLAATSNHDAMDGEELQDRLRRAVQAIVDSWTTVPLEAVQAAIKPLEAIGVTPTQAPNPPEPSANPSLHLSASALDAYAKCPRQYQFKHVLHIPARTGGAAVAGSNVHRALEEFHRRHPQDWRTKTTADLLAIFDEVAAEGRYASKQEADAFRTLGHRILSVYLDDERKNAAEPIGFEMPFRVAIPELETEFYGFIDRVDEHPDGSVEIIDYKTGEIQGAQGTLNQTWQLPLYALALEQLGRRVKAVTLYGMKEASLGKGPIERLRIPRLTKGKDRTELTDATMQGFKDRLATAIQGIRGQDFHEDPEYGKCRFCDYRILCPAMED